jgi:hypothetical protein
MFSKSWYVKEIIPDRNGVMAHLRFNLFCRDSMVVLTNLYFLPTKMCRFRIHPNFTYYYSQDFLGKILDTKTHNVISLPKLCDISGYKTGFYLHTATENKKGVSCTQTCCSHVIQNTKHVLLYLMLCMVFRWLFNIIICHYCVSKTTKELITLYIGKKKKTKPNTSQGLKVC